MFPEKIESNLDQSSVVTEKIAPMKKPCLDSNIVVLDKITPHKAVIRLLLQEQLYLDPKCMATGKISFHGAV